MDIVIAGPTENQVDTIYREVCNFFNNSNIHQFTDALYAVQHIVNHDVDIVIADAEIRNPLNTTKFVQLLLKCKLSMDIVIVSDDEGYKRIATEAGADFFTSYDGLGKVFAKLHKPREDFNDE